MQDSIKKFEDKMTKSIDVLLEEYASIRAGRANPHVLDRIKVEYYGTPTPIQQVGNISVPEPRIIQISPWEKSLLKEIEKAINMSDLGINPTNDGSCIRLVFPELTEERRKELVKDVKKKVLFNDQVINMLVDVNKTYDLVLKDIDGKDIALDLPEGLEYKDSKITVKKSGFFELEYQYGKIRILALKESDLKERTDLNFYTMDSLTAYYSVLNELKTLYENLKTNPSLEQGKYFATKLEELKEKEKQLKLDKDYVKNLIEEIKKSEYKDIYLDGELDNLDVFTNEADLIGKLKSLTLKKDNYTYDKLMKKLKLRNGFKAKEIENSTDTLEEKINKINDYLTSTNNITKDIETADNIIKNHNFRVIDSTYCVNDNNHLVILPIPNFRKDTAKHFENNTFIEYLFSDETLEQKLGVELTQYLGETFKRFDDSKIDSIKSQIIKNIDKLDKDDFIYFKPLFEKIAQIIKYQLPSA